MSQRNPMNERYTGDHKGGSTRKSAASAKPVSRAASSVRLESDKPKKKGLFAKRTPEEKQEHKTERKQEAQVSKEERKTGRARLRAIQRYVPDTPQFKALNRKRIIYSAIGDYANGANCSYRNHDRIVGVLLYQCSYRLQAVTSFASGGVRACGAQGS